MRLHKVNDETYYGKKQFLYAIISLLITVCMIMTPYTAVSAAAPEPSTTAGNTTVEQPKTITQPKYGIMTSRADGGYTYYNMNNQSENNAAIEVTEKGHVMVPVIELSQLMNGVNYQYNKAKKTMTVTNTLNG